MTIIRLPSKMPMWHYRFNMQYVACKYMAIKAFDAWRSTLCELYDIIVQKEKYLPRFYVGAEKADVDTFSSEERTRAEQIATEN